MSETRDEIVETLRGHADALDARDMTPGGAANETRRLAREIEQDGPEARTDGSGTAAAVREYGVAGINLTERAMGNCFYLATAFMWVVAGTEGVSSAGLFLFLAGFLTLALGNRFKGWSR